MGEGAEDGSRPVARAMRSVARCAALGLAGCLVWTAACGSFVEAGSGGADASVAAPPDARVGSDAATASDAAFECPDGAFCDDFERESVRGDWANAATFEGGALEIDARFSTTPTRSVHATADGRTFPYSRACVQRQAPRADEATIEFDARFEGTANGLQLVGFNFANRSFLELLFSPTGILVLAEQTYPTSGGNNVFREASPPFPAPPPNEWLRYSLRFDRVSRMVWGSVGTETRELSLSAAVIDEVFENICVGVAYVENNVASVWIDHVVIR